MVVRLFDSMKMESQSIRFTIQEATTSLSAAYKVEQTNNNVLSVLRNFNSKAFAFEIATVILLFHPLVTFIYIGGTCVCAE